MSVRVFPDLEALSIAAAETFIAQASLAQGRFRVALAGGNTPKRLYELLAEPNYRHQVEWEAVEVFFGDERWVPPNDPASNEAMSREALLDKVLIPKDQVYPMYREGGVLAGANAYEEILRDHGPLDLVLLGMGDDGHTASLFPNIPELEVTDRLVVPTISPKGVPQRLSMTAPALCAARLVVFLVAGADKREPLKRALGEDDSLRPPSGVVAKGANAVTWFVDQAAGS